MSFSNFPDDDEFLGISFDGPFDSNWGNSSGNVFDTVADDEGTAEESDPEAHNVFDTPKERSVDVQSSNPFEPLPDMSSQCQTDVSVLPSVPDYYEKFTAAVSNNDPNATFSQLGQFLENKQRCDHVAMPEKAQIQGMFTHNAKVCLFTINLFECNGEHNGQHGVLVECLRHSGCVMSFNSFYKEVASLFQKKAVRSLRRAPPSLSLGLGSSFETKQDDFSHLGPLLQSALCQCTQTQRDSVYSLCHASENMDNHEFLSTAEELAAILVAALESGDDLTRCAGAILLDNMCSHQHVQSTCHEKLMPIISACCEEEEFDRDSDCFRYLIQSQTKQYLSSSLRKLDTGFY